MKNWKSLYFLKIDSTNKVAFDLIEKNRAFDHHIIIADEQISGRGRQDRKWESEKGNLYCSIILQLNQDFKLTDYSFLTACVIGSTLEKFNIKSKYKWPNDIFFLDKKLGGILLQFQIINRINYLVIGIGLNLQKAPSYAISLKDYQIDREEFIKEMTKIFDIYDQKYQQFGFKIIRNELLNKAYKINENIHLSSGKEGIFTDIDEDGNLMLKDADDKLIKITIDEIIH